MHQFESATCTAVAEAVLDRCVWTNAMWITDPTKVRVEFNYEFLDDYRDEPLKQWGKTKIPSFASVGAKDQNQGRPVFSAKDHPLTLMVSSFEFCHVPTVSHVCTLCTTGECILIALSCLHTEHIVVSSILSTSVDTLATSG